jgi:hypothetical protein
MCYQPLIQRGRHQLAYRTRRHLLVPPTRFLGLRPLRMEVNADITKDQEGEGRGRERYFEVDSMGVRLGHL